MHKEIMNKIHGTLAWPLAARAVYSRKFPDKFYDSLSEKIAKELGFDADKVTEYPNFIFYMARTQHFDEELSAQLDENAPKIIVDMGAGLDTAFYRFNLNLANNVLWANIDLPDVIKLREEFLPEKYNLLIANIGASILDFSSWIPLIKERDYKYFFRASGLFQYYDESEIKSLLLEIEKHFPGSDLIFDCPSKDIIAASNTVLTEDHLLPDGAIKWGLDDATELESWSPNIKLVYQTPYFARLMNLPGLELNLYNRMIDYGYVNRSKIIKIRFSENLI